MTHVQLDYSKIQVVEIDGIDHSDYPKYTDAFISKALIDGVEATDEELDIINSNDEFRYESVYDNLN